MTAQQIETIIGEYHFDMDVWVPLDRFNIIFLSQEANIYIDKNCRYRANTTTNCIEVVKGTVDKNGVFKSSLGETDPLRFIPDEYYSFDNIDGFIQTAYLHPSIGFLQ